MHQELVGLSSVKTSVIFLTEVELLAFTTDYFQVVLVYDIFYDISMTFLLPSQLLSPKYKPLVYIRVTTCNLFEADIHKIPSSAAESAAMHRFEAWVA